MLLDLFKSRPVLDEESVQWLFDVYEWALLNFDADIFFKHSTLVLPSNQFFPGHANNAHEMATLIFTKVQEYAAVSHWPCRLTSEQSCSTEPARLVLSGPPRSVEPVGSTDIDVAERLPIFYDPMLVSNPEGIIATFAHTLAHYLGAMAEELPPAGEDNWPMVTEVLAVYLGFGLMFANSAFNYRNKACGSCQPVTVNRQSWLSQYDICYALAIFCVLKDIPINQTAPHLKKSLRPFFKKAYKDVRKREDELDRLLLIKNKVLS